MYLSILCVAVCLCAVSAGGFQGGYGGYQGGYGSGAGYQGYGGHGGGYGYGFKKV